MVMIHIKKVNEMQDGSYHNDVVNVRVPIHFTKDDARNIRNIAVLLESISTKWSDFVDSHEEMTDSDTDGVVKNLSLVAKRLMGEWEDSVIF